MVGWSRRPFRAVRGCWKCSLPIVSKASQCAGLVKGSLPADDPNGSSMGYCLRVWNSPCLPSRSIGRFESRR